MVKNHRRRSWRGSTGMQEHTVHLAHTPQKAFLPYGTWERCWSRAYFPHVRYQCLKSWRIWGAVISIPNSHQNKTVLDRSSASHLETQWFFVVVVFIWSVSVYLCSLFSWSPVFALSIMFGSRRVKEDAAWPLRVLLYKTFSPSHSHKCSMLLQSSAHRRSTPSKRCHTATTQIERKQIFNLIVFPINPLIPCSSHKSQIFWACETSSRFPELSGKP